MVRSVVMGRVVCLLVVTFGVGVAAGDWPQFRGPAGNGQAQESRVPTSWSQDQLVAWKTAIPGQAWSTPIVVGDRVFVTTAIPQREKQIASVAARPGPSVGDDAAKKDSPPAKAPAKEPPPVTLCRWEVCCLDWNTGSVLWKKVVKEMPPPLPIHPGNT